MSSKSINYNSALGFFTRHLLAWNQSDNQRTMPWKGLRDPYRIWLSEIILQQTRVEQGLPYYERFISTYPTVEHLAAAPEAAVFKLWEGLGYYSRCRNLLATARFISNDCGGKFPASYDELLRLPGVGPYTAAAIASFAWNLPHAVLDGNVFRVLARYFGQAMPIDSTEGKRWFAEQAQLLLPEQQAGEYNQAIMDLGAVVCTPKNPACESCPLANRCVAFQQQSTALFPVKSPARPKQERWMHYLLVEYRKQVLVRLRDQKDIWQGLTELVPLAVNRDLPKSANALQRLLQKELNGLPFTLLTVSPLQQQVLSHRVVKSRIVRIRVGKLPVSWQSEYRKQPLEQLNDLAFPRILTRFLADNHDLQR